VRDFVTFLCKMDMISIGFTAAIYACIERIVTVTCRKGVVP
jgi:hypothetical protein